MPDAGEELETLLDQLFVSPAFKQYQENVERFVHPSSPATLRQRIEELDIDGVKHLLETEFNAVARGEYRWLRVVVEDDLDYEGVAEDLIDTHRDTPWFYFEPAAPDARPLLDQHHSSCPHQSAVSGRGEEQDYKYGDVHRQVEELCGLAGIIPRRDHCWDGEIELAEDTATITYRQGTESCRRLGEIAGRLRAAFRLLQDREVCCERFTILTYKQESFARMHTVSAMAVQRLTSVLQDEATPQMVDEALKPFIDLIGTSNAALTLQVLCLALMSYSRAHGGVKPFFLLKPICRYVLKGFGEHQMCAQEIDLTCLSGLSRGPVLAFCLSAEPVLERVDILAKPEDIIDTWGRAVLITTRELQDCGKVYAIEVGGGTMIRALSDVALEPAYPSLHWESFDTSPRVSDRSFCLKDLYLVGVSHVRTNDQCALRRTPSLTLLQNGSHCMNMLGTSQDSYAVKSRQVGISGGQYVLLNAATTWEKRVGITAKEKIIADVQSSDCNFFFADLEAFYGIQFSYCTGLARRVRLRVILADVVKAYVRCSAKRPADWEELKEKLPKALRERGFRKWCDELSDTQRNSVIEIIARLIIHLSSTGINHQDELVIAWVTREDPRICLRVHSSRQNLWQRVLRDSEECATFACITTRCFETDHRRCHGENVCWPNKAPLFYTELYGETAPIALQDKAKYWVGPLDARLSAVVNGGTDLPTLEVSMPRFMEVPEKFLQHLMARQMRSHLCERGRALALTTPVLIRSSCPQRV